MLLSLAIARWKIAGQSSKLPCTRRMLDHPEVSAFAAEDEWLRVTPRIVKSLVNSGEARSERITLRPWLPVAPVMRRALGIVSFTTVLNLIVEKFQAFVDRRNAPKILIVLRCYPQSPLDFSELWTLIILSLRSRGPLYIANEPLSEHGSHAGISMTCTGSRAIFKREKVILQTRGILGGELSRSAHGTEMCRA